MGKFERWCLSQARKNKAWALKTKKDKHWLSQASDMSKQMLQEYLAKPVEQLAEEECAYRKMRACARERRAFGMNVWIAPDQRNLYKKITGRFPTCRVKG